MRVVCLGDTNVPCFYNHTPPSFLISLCVCELFQLWKKNRNAFARFIPNFYVVHLRVVSKKKEFFFEPPPSLLDSATQNTQVQSFFLLLGFLSQLILSFWPRFGVNVTSFLRSDTNYENMPREPVFISFLFSVSGLLCSVTTGPAHCLVGSIFLSDFDCPILRL